jgi:transposase-like protein
MMGRKRAADWRALVVNQAGSGLSAAAFCRNHHLNLHQFYQWRRRFENEQPKSPSAGFVQLVPCSKEAKSGIRLRLGDELSIEVERGFDPLTLRAVIEAIGGRRKSACLP